jgi:hypothetical protein
MDKLKKYLEEYYDIDLNDLQCNRKLAELIEEYGEDQWARGHEVGKEDGFEAGFSHCSS